MATITKLWREVYEKGNKEPIRQLLELDPNQAKAMEYGVSLLHIAAGSGYSEEVQLLLSNGADVNSTDADGDTPLHKAASSSNPDICRILLRQGASATIMNSRGQLPVDCAKKGDVWAWKEDYEQTIKILEEPAEGI